MTWLRRSFHENHVPTRTLAVLVLVILIGGLTGFYVLFAEREVPPWDPSSMVLLSKAMLESATIQHIDINNAEVGPYFNPHGFDIRAPGDPQPYSVFPPGFSLVLAAAYKLGGLHWLYLLSPLLTALGLGAAAYLGYQLGGTWASVFAVILIATSRVVTTFATSLWADGPSLAFLLLGLALYVTARASERTPLFLLSGFCLGLLILCKFVNVVFVVLILGYHLAVTRGRQRAVWLGWLSLGLLPGVVGLLLYQSRAYGGALASAYRPWGQSLYNFPLFSIRYLFDKSPMPWNDISSQAIVQGLLRDMRIWLLLPLVGLIVGRRRSLAWLFALIALGNIAIYAVSVFTPRQFINMRYLLPALAAGYMLAAVALAWIAARMRSKIAQAALVSAVVVFSVGSLIWQTIPELTSRNTGTSNTIKLVQGTAQTMTPDSIVLAYSLADTFILYGNLSALNYRRIEASDIEQRNQLVLDAIDRLLATGKPVYLVQDDEHQFGSIYPDIQRRYLLRKVGTPLLAYQLSVANNNGQP